MTHNLIAKAAAIACLIAGSLSVSAANTKQTVEKVSGMVSLTADVDYIVTSATPFADGAVVDIVNTDHAVLILDNVKPSAALNLLTNHVKINGKRAVNDNTCQVKLYNRGCIILPYAANFKPLTVYDEANFGGKSCNDFGLENNGGFMNTLSAEKLNNRISSFKLKRGYMVTFSLRPNGRGYSRCFIADKQDLEIAQLPGLMDNAISSYRVFKWYDTGKQALANDTRKSSVDILNVTSCYSFGTGEDRGIDCECVPHHIYEDWPSAAACGSVSFSPHMKTNNEPGNSADDHPQSVATILNNWESLMATGMRLCSPSSHDGSLAHLRECLDSIDARGWRCDIIDLHCYWAEGSFSTWSFYDQWANKYGRPIWISEWVWGASWNSNGAFANGVTEQQNLEAVQRICEKLNGWDCIERYYYWNSERDPSKILRNNGTLTPTGQYYATINSGVGYNGKYNYIPKTPKQYEPGSLSIDYDKHTRKAVLSWYESNGEMNQLYTVERRLSGGYWTVLADVETKEYPSNYTFTDNEAVVGAQYRIHIIDANGKEMRTNIVMAASDEITTGDQIVSDGQTLYLGANLLTNGDFNLGTYGWTNGEGKELAFPWFKVIPAGGVDDSPYLQTYGNGGIGTASAVRTLVDIEPNTNYHFSGASCNNASVLALLNLSQDGQTLATTNGGMLSNKTENWLTQSKTFNSEDNTKAVVAFRSLKNGAQFDNLFLARLFPTAEEAYADGVAKMKEQLQLFTQFNTIVPSLNADIQARIAAITGSSEADFISIETLKSKVVAAYKAAQAVAEKKDYCETLVALQLAGCDELSQAMNAVLNATDVEAAIEAKATFDTALSYYESYEEVADAVTQPMLKSSDGWNVKAGTFKGGDQRVNTLDGTTFWNAYWSNVSATQGENLTMQINQTVSNLKEGYYALAVDATTEHNCLADQHAFITTADGTKAISDCLTADYMDLPSLSAENRWQTLITRPVYVAEGGSVTIGFEGSKKGATDGAFTKLGDSDAKGDNREGWWGATNFRLMYHAVRKTSVEAGTWQTICMPYVTTASEGVRFYEIAGLTDNYTKVCLEEVKSVAAGLPAIYRSEKSDVVFYQNGAYEEYELDGRNNLKGYYARSGRPKAGEYVLENNKWTRLTARGNKMQPNTAVIETVVGIPVINSWDGLTIDIEGAAQEIADGISLPIAADEASSKWYTIDGRHLDSQTAKSGIYIRMKNGRAFKTIVK